MRFCMTLHQHDQVITTVINKGWMKNCPKRVTSLADVIGSLAQIVAEPKHQSSKQCSKQCPDVNKWPQVVFISALGNCRYASAIVTGRHILHGAARLEIYHPTQNIGDNFEIFSPKWQCHFFPSALKHNQVQSSTTPTYDCQRIADQHRLTAGQIIECCKKQRQIKKRWFTHQISNDKDSHLTLIILNVNKNLRNTISDICLFMLY